MKCNNCGTELGTNDVFCPNCGTPVQKDTAKREVQNENMYTYERNVNQQPNYNQQPQQRPVNQNYGQDNNYGQPYQKSKNTGDIVKICVGTLIGIIILVAIVFIIYSVISALDKDKNNTETGNNKPTTSSTESNNNSGTVTSVSNTKSSSYKVNYAGFKLYIPDNLVYEMDYVNDELFIGDEEQTWIAEFLIQQGSFQQLKNNKNQLNILLTEQLQSYNAKVGIATVETIGGVEFILLEAEISGEKGLFGFAGLNSMYSAYFTMRNEDNDFNRELLKNLATIISTAEYTGDSQYLKSNDKIKLTDIYKAFDKAIETKNGE